MDEVSVADVIADLSFGAEGEIMELTEKIRACVDPQDALQLMIDAITDGSTELWGASFYLVGLLEELTDGAQGAEARGSGIPR